MRVLHVLATTQRRGAEIFASDLIAALDEHGLEQRTFVLRDDDGEVDRSSRHRRPGVPLPGLNVRVAAIGSLAKLIGGWEPDVVQAHGGEAFKHAVLATRRRGVPVVYRRIGMSPRWIRHGPRRLAHRALMRRAARVVAVAEAVRSETIDLFGVAARNVVTIPNAIDPERLEPSVGREAMRRSLGIGPSAPVVLSVGALTWEKDPLTHVEVGRRVLANLSDAVHVFVGDGPLREEAQRRAMGSGVGERMTFLGSRSDVADLLAAGDVVLMASRPDGMEGMPGIAIEAGLAGLPVAAYAVAGLSEVVVDGTTGLLARPGDIEGLTDRLVSLLLDAPMRTRMGTEARSRCRLHFDIAAVAPRYLRVYEDVARTIRPAATGPGGPPVRQRVLILIKGLGRGGAEQILASAAPHLDRTRFDYELAYLLPRKNALVKELEDAGVPTHCLDGARSVAWIPRLRRLVAERHFDLIHAHSPVIASAARVALAPNGPPIVYTEHNVWERYHRLTYWSNMLTFGRSRHVFAVSDHVRESVRYPRPLTLLPMPPVETLYHGIDQASIEAWARRNGVREELGLADDAPVVGTVANFKSHKRLDQLIRAADVVRQRIPSVRFVFVGQGPLEDELRSLAHDLDLDETIVFTGFREDAPRVCSTFDVFALSSQHEGLSIALIEAMALGKPAVVTDVGGLPEVIEDGRQGFIVPVGRYAALADRIVRLLEDPALRARMGREGRTRADDFDIRHSVRRLEQVYEEILG